MRVIITCAPGLGPYSTLLPIARAFVRAGAVTIVAVSPNLHLPGRDEGIDFIARRPIAYPQGSPPAGADERQWWHPQRVRMAVEGYEDMRGVIQSVRPDVLLADTNDRGAILAACAAHLPIVRIAMTSDAATLRIAQVERTIRADLASLLGINLDDKQSPSISLMPPSFFADTIDTSSKMAAYRDPDFVNRCDQKVQRNQPSSKPTVLISAGTTTRANAIDQLRLRLREVEAAGMQAIAVGLAADTIKKMQHEGGQHRFLGREDLESWYRSVDLISFHGGFSTTREGLMLGLPLHVRPAFGDHPYVAQRVPALGVGTASTSPENEEGEPILKMTERCAAQAQKFAREFDGLPSLSRLPSDLHKLI